MTIIYAVTSGQYEDYEIDGVFSDTPKGKDLAKKLSNAIRDSNGVAEWTLDELPYNEKVNEKIEKGYKLYSITLDEDGNETGVGGICHPEDGSKDKRNFDIDYMSGKDKNGKYKVIWYNEWNFHCWAKNEDEALDEANQRRIKLLKNGKWFSEELL